MNTALSPRDSLLINRYRGLSIMRVVFVHLGLSWFLVPYSTYVGMFLPILFFCSGYLSLFLYRNRTSDKDFMVRRLTGIFIPFYLIYAVASLISLGMGLGNGIETWRGLFQALVIAPSREQMPYPLGQIWFLRVVVFSTLFSPFFFHLSARNRKALLVPVLLGALVAVLRGLGMVPSHVSIVGYNLFQCVVYGAFYFLGSYFYAVDWRAAARQIWVAIGILLVVGLAGFQFSNGSTNLGDHSYIPDLFYFSLGTLGILLVLALASQFETLFRVAPPVAAMCDFAGKHSYGIYLLHTFFILFAEKKFGWVDVMGNPPLALAKIVFVVAMSMVCAMPFTWATKQIRRQLRGRLWK